MDKIMRINHKSPKFVLLIHLIMQLTETYSHETASLTEWNAANLTSQKSDNRSEFQQKVLIGSSQPTAIIIETIPSVVEQILSNLNNDLTTKSFSKNATEHSRSKRAFILTKDKNNKSKFNLSVESGDQIDAIAGYEPQKITQSTTSGKISQPLNDSINSASRTVAVPSIATYYEVPRQRQLNRNFNLNDYDSLSARKLEQKQHNLYNVFSTNPPTAQPIYKQPNHYIPNHNQPSSIYSNNFYATSTQKSTTNIQQRPTVLQNVIHNPYYSTATTHYNHYNQQPKSEHVYPNSQINSQPNYLPFYKATASPLNDSNLLLRNNQFQHIKLPEPIGISKKNRQKLVPTSNDYTFELLSKYDKAPRPFAKKQNIHHQIIEHPVENIQTTTESAKLYSNLNAFYPTVFTKPLNPVTISVQDHKYEKHKSIQNFNPVTSEKKKSSKKKKNDYSKEKNIFLPTPNSYKVIEDIELNPAKSQKEKLSNKKKSNYNKDKEIFLPTPNSYKVNENTEVGSYEDKKNDDIHEDEDYYSEEEVPKEGVQFYNNDETTKKDFSNLDKQKYKPKLHSENNKIKINYKDTVDDRIRKNKWISDYDGKNEYNNDNKNKNDEYRDDDYKQEQIKDDYDDEAGKKSRETLEYGNDDGNDDNNREPSESQFVSQSLVKKPKKKLRILVLDQAKEGSHPEADHKVNKKKDESHEEGAGGEHKEEHHEEHGEDEEKKYDSKHENEKGEKGYHDKETHKKHYEDEQGEKKGHKEEENYHKEEHKEEGAEKEATFQEKGEHKKGHSTKGQHSIHKKDEYEKKTEFFDEFHDEGDDEKGGANYHEHHSEKGSDYKSGYHSDNHDEEKHGKSGTFKKGHSHHQDKGHKYDEGHDQRHHHEQKAGKKKEHGDKKKWHFKKSDDGKR